MEEHVFDRYLKTEKLKTMWCPGCGNGIVLQALIRALDESGVEQNQVAVISGIGCSSRSVNYLNTCTLHTNHGRAIPYATGVKMANPRLTVVVITGDGDCASIGGNHLIQACRRNIDLTVIVVNNENYGMTGGQFSSTTPQDSVTKTSPLGSYEEPFDICSLAMGAGATYVARGMTCQPVHLKNMILHGLWHQGLSVVDAISDCPTLYGRLNKLGSPGQMLRRREELFVPVAKANTMTKEELAGRCVCGEFVNRKDRMEYTARYARMVQRIKGELE